MQKILKTAQAGTAESSDAIITIAPAEAGSGIQLDIQSTVMLQYGDLIQATVKQVITNQGVADAAVKVADRGALDYTLQARTLAALGRAGVQLKEVSL